jgi:hypothetical protein
MTFNMLRACALSTVLVVLLPAAVAGWPDAAAPESRRMARAKDLIADEQWTRAIQELRAAIADPKEPGKAEALFWLAHSLNQDSDFASAVEAIRRLERDYRSSPWVRPARSLLLELAHKLKRDDVLWWTAVRPAARPKPVAPVTEVTPRRRTPGRPAPQAVAVRPTDKPPKVIPPTPMPPVPATAPSAWVAENWRPDADHRILALGSLIHSDAEKVIPMLRKIAMEENPGAGRRAIFVLAQSRKPEALSTVVEVAKEGPDAVRVAAVRSLGNFGGPEVSKTLLQVYSKAKPQVKRQVVESLGERAEAPALLRIAQSEADQSLRAIAMVTLGRAGGREQLLSLYSNAERASKRPIIMGLFLARGEDELIRIADTEEDRQLRAEVLRRLRLLGTPKAKAYLAKVNR